MTYSFHHVILYHNQRRPFTCQRKISKFQRKNEMTEFINKTNSLKIKLNDKIYDGEWKRTVYQCLAPPSVCLSSIIHFHQGYQYNQRRIEDRVRPLPPVNFFWGERGVFINFNCISSTYVIVVNIQYLQYVLNLYSHHKNIELCMCEAASK